MIEKTKLPQAAFVAENATVRGRVTAGPGSSIYFGAVIRSESEETLIGPRHQYPGQLRPPHRCGLPHPHRPGLHHRPRGHSPRLHHRR